jgi:O-Antigen ligase
LSAHAAPFSRAAGGRPFAAALSRVAGQCWLTLSIAVALVAICFTAKAAVGTVDGSPVASGLAANTVVQIVLTLAGGMLIALACAVRPVGRVRVFGLASALALVALAAFTAMSVNWSLAPAGSWLEANRTLSYAAAFGGAIALVRMRGDRWRSVIGGVLLATLVVSAYAVASKVFPAALDAQGTSRLSVPFVYSNAVGLTAALGLPPALWLGSRREGHGALGALAAPAVALLLIALVLSYSRGAVLATAVGLALWFAITPLRLRALSVLAIGGVAGAAVVAWTLRQPALADDHVALVARSAAGHRLAPLLVLALALAFLTALVLRFAAERSPLSAARRRQLATVVVVAIALVPVAGVGALAVSSRGLFGTISHGWHNLTTPDSAQPSNTAGRFTSTGSMQARYWHYALEVFDTSPVVGAGAGAYAVADQRFMTSKALAVNAHGYVFQTLADLGVVGLLLTLAVAFGWILAAMRTVGSLRPRAPDANAAQRAGLLTMVAVVVIFTVHSAVDWTWFVPGDALIALLCAGWVAGRGPWRERAGAGRPSLSRLANAPFATAGAAAAIAVALIVAWSQWQPLRGEQAANAGSSVLDDAIVAFGAGSTALGNRDIAIARADEVAAIAHDPLDITPLKYLADVYVQEGQLGRAEATLLKAVTLQPSNSAGWFNLWTFENNTSYNTAIGNRALAIAIHLNPSNPDYLRVALETATTH